jgi:capsular polysaccharide biosynthesis protein
MQDSLRPTAPDLGERDADLIDVVLPLARHWKLLLAGPVAAGALALAATFLYAPVFTARTTFLPPQQQQNAAATALASLGALSALTGAASLRTPADQYVALLQSTTIEERLMDAFELVKVYGAKRRSEAREELEDRVRVAAGKKDGLISIEVDDESPERAAAMANRLVDELPSPHAIALPPRSRPCNRAASMPPRCAPNRRPSPRATPGSRRR